MKKIGLFFLLFCFVFIANASAQTYYGTIGSFGDYQEELINSSLDNQIRADIFYRRYRIERENGGYYLSDNHPSEYPYRDYNVFRNGSWSEWTDETVTHQEGRMIQERIVYQVMRRRGVRYFYIYDVSGSFGQFQMSELSFYHQGKKIDVRYECETCSFGFETIAGNTIVEEQPFSMKNGSILKVDLQAEYPMEEINMILGLYDEGYEQKDFRMAFDYCDYLLEIPYYHNTIASAFTYADFKEIETRKFGINDFAMSMPIWEEFLSLEKLPETENMVVTPMIQRRYRDTFYQFYKEKKLYEEGYYQNTSDEYPYLDYESGKVFYQEQKKEMIQFNDHPIIQNKEDLEKALIQYSNVAYQLFETIDYQKNGFYEVEIVTDFLRVIKKVEVRSLENEKKIYQEQLEKEQEWLQKENQKLSALLSAKEKEITEKQKRIEILEKEMEQNKSLEETVRKLEREIQTKNVEIQKLTLELEVLKRKQEELVRQLQSITCGSFERKEEACILENCTSLQKQIQNQESELVKLKKEEQSMQDQIKEYQKEGYQKEVLLWFLIPFSIFLLLLNVIRKKKSSFVETV